jgi:sterol desaturase/sphingolipid hydroxylase (fatty acid hydroxylase superfamily)
MLPMLGTHPMQLASIALLGALNAAGLAIINARKRAPGGDHEGKPSPVPWARRRNAFWLLISLLFAAAVGLDLWFPQVDPAVMSVKAYVFAFPVGLLDLHFSSTKGVPSMVILGAVLWCSTLLLRQWFVDGWYGYEHDGAFFGDSNGTVGPARVSPRIVVDVSPRSLAVELFRYVVMLPCVGLLSDLFFSPMHRVAHHPKLYANNHKVHHEYTHTLTSLVLYHGSVLDDFLMPWTTFVGGCLYVLLLGTVGLQHEAFSSVGGYLIVMNTLLSHSHDIRCSRLMAPLPDSLNFVAYHYVHHISPNRNFGLTEPSDQIWDYILGVNTIKKMDPSGGAKSEKSTGGKINSTAPAQGPRDDARLLKRRGKGRAG